MVKLISIPSKNSLIDTESIPKSTLQVLFICSIIGNAVFARKDDKLHESKPNYPTPYRFNDELETGFDENRNYRNDQQDSNWNRMKGVYGYRNSDAFRMMDYLGRNYAFSSNSKPVEPSVSSSNPADVILKGEDSLQESKAKIQLKNLLQNHRQENEMVEQKPERLTQIEEDQEEDEDVTEIPVTSTTSISPPEFTSASSTTTTSTTTTTTASPTTISSSPKLPSLQNIHREIEGIPNVPSVPPSTPTVLTNPSSSIPSDLFAAEVNKQQQQHKKDLHHKLSVHQLISESMPTLQMSVSPIYFYNKATKSLVAVPYLIMKSISKMPLLPNMMDAVGSQLGGSNNLLNYVNTPFNQKMRSRPISHLAPLIRGFESEETSNYNGKVPGYLPADEAESSRWLSFQSLNAQHALNL